MAEALLELSPPSSPRPASGGTEGFPALRVHVLDVDIDLAPRLGLPQCVLGPTNITVRYPLSDKPSLTLPLQGKLSVTRAAHHLEGYFI